LVLSFVDQQHSVEWRIRFSGDCSLRGHSAPFQIFIFTQYVDWDEGKV